MMKNKIVFYGILVIVVLVIIGISLLVLNRPTQTSSTTTKIPDPSKYCTSAKDCVPVMCICGCSGCGGFSYEDIVNKNYVDKWYNEHNCSPAMECPEVCCPPVIKVCEDNTCKVKPRTRENIPKELLEKEAIDKKLCYQTGGFWIEEVPWDVGKCRCKNNLDDPEKYFELGRYVFIDGRGCVSQRTLCEESGSVWKKPEVSVVENREDIPKENCITRSIYTLMEWDEKNNLCILNRINDPNHRCLK